MKMKNKTENQTSKQKANEIRPNSKMKEQDYNERVNQFIYEMGGCN
jgi:hypothetical protein